MDDPYQVLGLGRDATPDQVRKAYRKRAKKAHPDSGGDEAEFRIVHTAYLILHDPVARERFDRTGKTDPPPPVNPDQWFISAVYEPLIDAIAELTQNGGPKAVDKTDVHAHLLDKLAEKKKELEEEVATYLQAGEALERAAARFKTGEEHNLLKSMILDNLKECKQKHDATVKEKDNLVRAIERVKNYDYEFEATVDNEFMFTGFQFPPSQWGHAGGW